MGLFRRKPKGQEIKMEVQGMTCNHCVMRVQKALTGVEGVLEADVSLERGEAIVRMSPGAGVTTDALSAAVEAAGYEAKPLGD